MESLFAKKNNIIDVKKQLFGGVKGKYNTIKANLNKSELSDTDVSGR